jgi:hypothetical protein
MLPRAGTTGAVRNAARAVATQLESDRAVDGLVARLGEARRGRVLELLDDVGVAPLPAHDPGEPLPGCAHLVCFCEDDDALVGSVVPFVVPALVAGGVAVLIATEEHLGGIQAGLEAVGVGTAHARRAGTLICLEAEEALGSLLAPGGAVDAERVHAVLGPVLDDAGRGGRTVRVYGEMVAVRWDRGDLPAALALEERWDDLAATRPFSLLCGYPTGVLDPEAPEPGRAVCARHTGLALAAAGGRRAG